MSPLNLFTNFAFDDQDMKAWKKTTIEREFKQALVTLCFDCKGRDKIISLKCYCRLCETCLKERAGKLQKCDCSKNIIHSIPTEVNFEMPLSSEDTNCFRCNKTVKAVKTSVLLRNVAREIKFIYDVRKNQRKEVTHLVCNDCRVNLVNIIEEKVKRLEEKTRPISIECNICGIEHCISYKVWLSYALNTEESNTRVIEKLCESTETNCFMCKTEVRLEDEVESKVSEFSKIYLETEGGRMKHFVCVRCYLKVKCQLHEKENKTKRSSEGRNLNIFCEYCKIVHVCLHSEWMKVSKMMRSNESCCAII